MAAADEGAQGPAAAVDAAGDAAGVAAACDGAATLGAVDAPPLEQALRVSKAVVPRTASRRRDSMDMGYLLGAPFGALQHGYVGTPPAVSYRCRVTYPTDAATVRRLLLHEATVHALPGRRLTDLGDAILLLDPTDPEPFWNRLAGVRWPDDADAFDQRLTELAVLFATMARQPHVWVSPPHDTPNDLAQRLASNGFEDAGPGLLLVLANGTSARAALAGEHGAQVVVERFAGSDGSAGSEGSTPAVDGAADAIVDVLIDAFDVAPELRAGIVAQTFASLTDPRFAYYLVRVGDVPASVARGATFDGVTYLSSIGTASWAQGRGLGRLVTAAAIVDGLDAGSRWVHLGVFADNDPAIALYRRLGFQMSGAPGPDMILVG